MKHLTLILLLSCFCKSIWASDFSFANQLQNNANPFVRIHGLPGYAGTELPDPGRIATNINLEITNELHQQTQDGEQINLDYERAQLNLSFVYGIKDDLAVGLILPYISNSGGFMDSLIDDWHDFFGLPEGGREDATNDEFTITYQGPATNFGVENTDKGIGDVLLFLDKQLTVSNQQNLKARVQLKLPTADEDQLFGSGGFGVSFSLHGSRQLSQKWNAYGMVGLSYLEDSKVLPEQQSNFIGNAVLGIAWSPTSRFGISAQLDLNSQIYDDTNLDALSGEAGVLNVSAHYQLTKHARILFGFNEDIINKDAAPDFGINLGFQYDIH